MTKPIVALIAGRAARPGRRMGHVGAVVSGGESRAESKIEALRQAGARIAELPEQVVTLLAEVCH
ncbi:MAG: hypothetical protein JXA74_11080 [Anaerolineae bacterium]|nr:hypothetical protein [Anaerolineae bacterium]